MDNKTAMATSLRISRRYAPLRVHACGLCERFFEPIQDAQTKKFIKDKNLLVKN